MDKKPTFTSCKSCEHYRFRTMAMVLTKEESGHRCFHPKWDGVVMHIVPRANQLPIDCPLMD